MSTVPVNVFPLPHATRSAVFTALFNLISSVLPPTGTEWLTKSQQLKLWDDVPSDQQPAIFLHRGPQLATQNHAYGATKWVWKVTIWIYYQVGALTTTPNYPDQLTDQFIDNVEKVMMTGPSGGVQTLGGLCVNCWIDGTIFVEPGINDAQAFILIPFSIML